MEREAQDLDEEINSVARQVAVRPSPIAGFDDETWKGGHNEIALRVFEQLESALLKQWNQRDQSGCTDLFTRPARLL